MYLPKIQIHVYTCITFQVALSLYLFFVVLQLLRSKPIFWISNSTISCPAQESTWIISPIFGVKIETVSNHHLDKMMGQYDNKPNWKNGRIKINSNILWRKCLCVILLSTLDHFFGFPWNNETCENFWRHKHKQKKHIADNHEMCESPVSPKSTVCSWRMASVWDVVWQKTSWGKAKKQLVCVITLLGNKHFPSQGTFEDDFPFPKVAYVSFLEGSCL